MRCDLVLPIARGAVPAQAPVSVNGGRVAAPHCGVRQRTAALPSISRCDDGPISLGGLPRPDPCVAGVTAGGTPLSLSPSTPSPDTLLLSLQQVAPASKRMV